MPQKPPPAPAKGTRHPGSGRRAGTPNKISIEARALAAQLVSDVDYQARLRRDFKTRRVHPTIESLIWTYHLGKPTQPIAMSGGLALDVTARLDEERSAFASLDLHDLEQLAAESQALVDRAFALARTAQSSATLALPATRIEEPAETLGNTAESDKQSYVNLQAEPAQAANSNGHSEIAGIAPHVDHDEK